MKCRPAGGAVVAGEERLVIGTILCVGRAAANIEGQGYRAGLFQGCEKFVTAPVERQHDGSVLVLGVDPGRETIGEDDRIAGTQPLGRPCEGKPTTGADVADQQSFERNILSAAAAGTNALQPRGNDLCVVEYQQVAAAQQARQITYRPVVQAVGRDIEQACGITRRDGPLGNEVVWKLEVEEIDAH